MDGESLLGQGTVPAWQALDFVRRAFVSLQRGQFPAAMKMIRADVTFDARATWPGVEVMVGHAGFLALMTAWYEPWRDVQSDLVELTARDGCALLQFSERAVAQDGTEAQRIAVWRCDVTPDGVSAIITSPTRAGGLAAAGLSGEAGAVVQAAWDAHARRDEAAWRALHASECPLGDWFDRPAGMTEPTVLEHVEAVGNTVVGVLDACAAPAPGAPRAQRPAVVHTVTDNRISQLEVFPTPAEARASAAAAARAPAPA